LFGDVNGAGLAVVFEGEVLGGMEGAAMVTAAGGAAAAVGIGAEGGGEDGGRGGEGLEAMLEHAKDEGGMIGDAHGGLGEGRKRSRA